MSNKQGNSYTSPTIEIDFFEIEDIVRTSMSSFEETRGDIFGE